MNTNRDLDQTLVAWLSDGPAELADRVLDAALDEVHLTRQRPRSSRPWRTLPMTSLRTWAVAAGVVLAVGVLGALVLSNTRGSAAVQATTGPTVPAASPVQSPAVAYASGVAAPSSTPGSSEPAASPSGATTAGWTPFTSARYGYTLRLPPGWSVAQSTGRWPLARTNEQPKPADHFGGTDPLTGTPNAEFSAFAVDLPAATSGDAWIAAFFAPDAKQSPSCRRSQDKYGSVDVQGHQATLWTEPHISTSCGGTYAFVVTGRRLYAFEVGGEGQEPILLALLSTVQLPG